MGNSTRLGGVGWKLVSVALLGALLASFPNCAWAATYYVAPTGKDSNAGTLDQPFASMARGQQAAAGDTVYLRGGRYAFTSNSEVNGILLDKSGAGHYFYNNTGFKNKAADFNMLGLNMVNTSVLRNNLAFGPLPTANLTGTDDKFNSWDLPVQVSEADFQSISITGMDAPRQADGSLPIVAFMRLLPTSDLIDKGVDIGQPFTGAAPDLGAYEGALLVAGSGGMSAGGAAGAGAGTGGDAGAPVSVSGASSAGFPGALGGRTQAVVAG
jgi:hypothetical protein